MRNWTLALILAVLLSACGGEPDAPAEWSVIEPDRMSVEQTSQRDKGLAAKDALFTRLFERLQGAFAEGPGEAIGACRVSAPEIAKAVATEQGVQIGRTSHRLRNPANTPPAWAEPFVRERMAEAVWLAHGDGRMAGLLPIPTKGMCLACHGSADELSEPIRAAIQELYPQDEATDFARGDLRGWFWLEIPAQ